MIVSKAMRNIRQKIDWTLANNTNAAMGLWQFPYSFEARDERLDAHSTYAFDATFMTVTGGDIADADWHQILAQYGDAATLANIKAWLTTNRTDLVTAYLVRNQNAVSLVQENTGRYLNIDSTYSTQFPAQNFRTIIVAIQNTYTGTASESQASYNYFEFSYTDLLNMGVPLVNNGDGTYKINILIDRMRIKISEDV